MQLAQYSAAIAGVIAMSTRVFFNVGPVDRGLRAALGAAILSLAFVGPQSPWGYLGLVPLVTAAIGSCPLYSLFGVDTCSTGGTR